jgi:Subtilase family
MIHMLVIEEAVMAVRGSKPRQVSQTDLRGGTLDEPLPPGHLPGQFIIRFKREAVEQVAAHPVRRSATTRTIAAAIPEEVAGPLELLRRDAGMMVMTPLFVPTGKAPPTRAAGTRSLASVHGVLVRSATETPREALRGFHLVEVKEKKATPALLKRLRASRAVEFVEPVPNKWLCAADPRINRQWGLRAIRWFDEARPDAEKVHVAVLDSGVDEKHPDLKGAIEEYLHAGNGARDFLGHGTHVSGIAAAVVNNSVGIAGVANCRLHCWKIFDDPPAGSKDQIFNFEYYSQALAAALDSDIKVVNLSIGGTDNSQTEAIIFQQLRDAGVVIVAAMGNEFEEGNPTEYPAGYPGVLAVGAVDEVERRATFSCTGSHIGLVAPGVNILSTVPRQKAILAAATDYDSWPGTSMATPHVAGAAALLYAKKPKLKASADEVFDRLKSSAKKVAGMGRKGFTKEYGFGLLDLAAALG